MTKLEARFSHRLWTRDSGDPGCPGPHWAGPGGQGRSEARGGNGGFARDAAQEGDRRSGARTQTCAELEAQERPRKARGVCEKSGRKRATSRESTRVRLFL